MSKKERWIFQEFLLKRWGIDQYTLSRILEDGLPCYDTDNQVFMWEDGIDKDTVKYRMDDVEKYEEEHPHIFGAEWQVLDAKEKRELGQLRREKEKWDASINVAVQIGIFCMEHGPNLTRKVIWDIAYEIDNDLPNTTLERIWKSIPANLKSKGGRPSKKK